MLSRVRKATDVNAHMYVTQCYGQPQAGSQAVAGAKRARAICNHWRVMRRSANTRVGTWTSPGSAVSVVAQVSPGRRSC